MKPAARRNPFAAGSFFRMLRNHPNPGTAKSPINKYNNKKRDTLNQKKTIAGKKILLQIKNCQILQKFPLTCEPIHNTLKKRICRPGFSPIMQKAKILQERTTLPGSKKKMN